MNDTLAKARSWNHLSQIYEILGPLGQFLECTERASELLLGENKESSKLSPPYQLELAITLYRKGWALYRLGQPEAAMEMAQQVMRLCAGLGISGLRGMAQGKRLMGVVHMMVGQYDNAEGHMKEALAAFQELGDRRWIARLWNALGENARLGGDYKAAVHAYQAALTIALETGNRDSEIMYRSNLGGAYVGLERYREAEQELEHATLLAGSAAWGGLSETECFLAEAYLEQGKLEQARDTAQQALARGIQAEQKEFIANGWRVLGRIAMRLDCGREPADCFSVSLRVFTEISMPGEQARTLWAWATHELTSGDPVRGKAMWQEARGLFEQLNMVQMVQRMDDSPLWPTA
ncbi:MAG: tetratricopeptide repeat protein [Ardenticatenales bacterium]|nr:tetratricopeptide repeat protein [Ardenticatenales bacterium]